MLILLVTTQDSPPSNIVSHITSTLISSSDSIVLLEFSVVPNTEYQLLAVMKCEEGHYGSLLLDLQHAVNLVKFEIGCQGIDKRP